MLTYGRSGRGGISLDVESEPGEQHYESGGNVDLDEEHLVPSLEKQLRLDQREVACVIRLCLQT